MSTQLYLLVTASPIGEPTIGVAANLITGAVHDPPGALWIRNKRRRREVRAADISEGNLWADQVQVTQRTVGHGHQVIIQHPNLHSWQRQANIHRARILLTCGGEHGGFGGAVQVPHLGTGIGHGSGYGLRQVLARNDGTHTAKFVRCGLSNEGPQAGGCFAAGHAMLGHECHDGAWVTVLQVVGDDQPRTRSHRCQILPTGDVEAEGRQRQQYIRIRKRHGVVGGSKQCLQICARNQHALRRSR